MSSSGCPPPYYQYHRSYTLGGRVFGPESRDPWTLCWPLPACDPYARGIPRPGGANGLMTMDLLDPTWEDMIDDGLKEPAGAATALAEAQDAITLII
jgi:hypothetical protein